MPVKGGSGEKSPQKDMKKIFSQLSNLSQPAFSLENPTYWVWKLQCAKFL